MKYVATTRSRTTIIFCIILSLFSIGATVITSYQWPPQISPEWIIGGILSIAMYFGSFSYWVIVLFPSQLTLEFSDKLICFTDRKMFKLTNTQIRVDEISRIVFYDGERTWIDLFNGKRTHMNEVVWGQDFLEKELGQRYPEKL